MKLGPKKRLGGMVVFTAVLLALTAATVALPRTSANFSATTSNSGNTFGYDVLDPPTAVTGSTGGAVVLTWTPSVDTYATGYQVYRSATPGGPYSKTADVTPVSATGYTENPAVGTYYYIVRTYFGAEVSDDSNEATAAAAAIGLASGWQTGTTHSASPGDNRILVFVASNEQQATTTPNLTAVTYGGQALTKIYSHQVASGGKAAINDIWILKEAQLQLATDSVLVSTWSASPDVALYSHVILDNVDQSSPTGSKAAATSTADTPNPLAIPPVPADNLDMVITAALAGEVGSYDPQNGFLVGINHQSTAGGTAAQGTAYKASLGSNETATMVFVPGSPPFINRQVQLVVVFKVAT